MLALGWSLRQRARLGMALAGILLLPGLATLWMARHKFMHPLPPAPAALSITAREVWTAAREEHSAAA